MKVTHDEYLDLFLDMLIKIMIKNKYDTISIDHIIQIKHEFKKDPVMVGLKK